jgi:predicted N-formylglutamate amidohydrolase
LKRKPYILITCEHADYKIPKFIKSELPEYIGPNKLKASHQAYDKYAYEVALTMKNEFKNLGIKSDMISYPYTRLILDANRTKKNKGFYSKLSTYLTPNELKKIELEYDKYVKKCESLIKKNIKLRDVYVFSIHSFTPRFNGKIRKTDLGVLFRTKVNKELSLAKDLQRELKLNNPKIKAHKNLPYRGHTDCFSNYILDQHLNNQNVNGLFFEFNQNYIKLNLKSKTKKLIVSLKNIILSN